MDNALKAIQDAIDMLEMEEMDVPELAQKHIQFALDHLYSATIVIEDMEEEDD